jgi:cyclophilin family peptidyl-prolyl cis-trans isomerase
MKLLSKSLKIVSLCLLVSLTSCKEQYPNLEDGLYAEIVTSKDTMLAKLFYQKVPVTVANFVALAEGNHPMVSEKHKGKRFYDSTTFHRVIDKFMIQGGDPTATGSGNPGYKFEDEFNPDLKHDKPGMLSMANSGPATNGSQFYITESPTPNLDNRHAVFGELVEGLDVLDSISNVKTDQSDKPIEDVVIYKINIIRKGSDAKAFEAAKVYEEELPKVKEKQEGLRELERLKAEEERQMREEKLKEAAAAMKPTLEDYNSKAKTLASGLKMYMIKEGEGPKPKQGQTVNVLYEGYFTDGMLFDSNDAEVAEANGVFDQRRMDAGMYGGMPVEVSPDAQMIAGFKEAIATLKVGDRAFFYLPSHLAYGERGNRGIKPNTDLTFIIEIKEIME